MSDKPEVDTRKSGAGNHRTKPGITLALKKGKQAATQAAKTSQRLTGAPVQLAENPQELSDADWSLQNNIGFRLACVSSRLDQELRDLLLRDLDLTYAHFRVLQVLFEQDGQQMGDVARAIVVRQPVLSRVIDQMEARKLVRRKQDKEDSRYMRVYLTPKGRQQYEQAWPTGHDVLRRALTVVSTEERDVLLELLTRIDLHMQNRN